MALHAVTHALRSTTAPRHLFTIQVIHSPRFKQYFGAGDLTSDIVLQMGGITIIIYNLHSTDRKSPPATPSFIYNPVAKITPTTAMNHEKGHHSNHWTSTNAFNTSPAPPPVTPATTPYHHGNGRHSNPHVTCSTDEEDEDEGAWSEQRSPPLDLTADKWRRSAPHDFWAAHPGRAGRGLWAGLTCLKMAANEEANHALWRPW